MKKLRLAVAILAGSLASLPAPAQEPPPWPDTFLARVAALALIQTLNADILASRSATRSLEDWCRDHRLADPPQILAYAIAGENKPPTEAQRRRLGVDAQEPVKYRRVQLRCGEHVLSEAENWYVPGRLSPETNRLLETTTTPFGKAVAALEPYRRTFSAELLWSPLPAGWAIDSSRQPDRSADPLAMPEALFAHRAVLYSRDHMPFSEVSEVYQRQILAFPPPPAR